MTSVPIDPAALHDEEERVVTEIFAAPSASLGPIDGSRSEALRSETGDEAHLAAALAEFEDVETISAERVQSDLEQALTRALSVGLALPEETSDDSSCKMERTVEVIDGTLVIVPLPAASDARVNSPQPVKPIAVKGGRPTPPAREPVSFFVCSTELQPDRRLIAQWLSAPSRRSRAAEVNLTLLRAMRETIALLVRRIDEAGRERLIGISVVAPSETNDLQSAILGPLVTAKDIDANVRVRALELCIRAPLLSLSEDEAATYLAGWRSQSETLALQSFGATPIDRSRDFDLDLFHEVAYHGRRLFKHLLPYRRPPSSREFTLWIPHGHSDFLISSTFNLDKTSRVLLTKSAELAFLSITYHDVGRDVAEFYSYLSDVSHAESSPDAGAETRTANAFLGSVLQLRAVLAEDLDKRNSPKGALRLPIVYEVQDAVSQSSGSHWTRGLLDRLIHAYATWRTGKGQSAGSGGGAALCFGFVDRNTAPRLPNVVARLGPSSASSASRGAI